MNQPDRYGFEGAGILVELLAAMAAACLVFPLVTIWRKASNVNRLKVSRGGYIWASLCTYCSSFLVGWWYVAHSLTDKAAQISIFACAGMMFSLSSLVFAFRARGRGRWSAIAGAILLTLIWFPFFSAECFFACDNGEGNLPATSLRQEFL